MPLFLSQLEKQSIQNARSTGDFTINRFYESLAFRVRRRSENPGLMGQGEDVAWWYPAAEYLSDAAMWHALEGDEIVGDWIREVGLGIARKPESEWVGPWYRDHVTRPAIGHLETAHLCWALGAVLDLASDVFSPAEREEIEEALQEKGITLCERWLQRNNHLANWRAVLVSGIAVAASVTGDRKHMVRAAQELPVCLQAFQPDGSYAESLQYANYLTNAIMLAYESLEHRAPELVDGVDISTYARGIPWVVASMLYAKPMPDWGEQPRARAVNFNDSGAMFRPSGDVLLHIASRCRKTLPAEAGLARWLFDTYYLPVPSQEPHYLATFGLRNDWGFLTLPFLIQAAEAVSPTQADLPLVHRFSNGNTFVRDKWNGETVLAIQAGSDSLYGPGHLHGDLNSFILAHRNERLLVDPGHSCYRNLIHGLESSSQTHNTCTFLIQRDRLGLQEDLAKATLLEQSNVSGRRRIDNGIVSAPVPARGRCLIVKRTGDATVVGSEAGGLYGDPIQEFSRFWVQAGQHVLFTIDRIRSSHPVTTMWNWLLNNRGGLSEFMVELPDRITMRKGAASLKIVHFGGGRFMGPVYAYVHDAYHPEPDRPGEGRPGSGRLYRWIEPEARTFRLAVHAFIYDAYGLENRWQVQSSGGQYIAADQAERWSLEVVSDTPLVVKLSDDNRNRHWKLIESTGAFSFDEI